MSDETLFCPQCNTQLSEGVRVCPMDHNITGGVHGVTRAELEATPRTKRQLLGLEVNQAYIIQGYLGSGGFGAVYRAEQKALERQVALKLLVLESSTEETVIERFKREAKTAAQILDPNVVTLFDYGEASLGDTDADRILYMAMELIDGPTLRKVIKRSKGLGLDASLKVGVAILRGLTAAHQLGVVHRDMKPSNVLIDESKGREWHARLFDFGIASLQGAGNHTQLTHEGGVLGTPKYMAPEQWRALPTMPATDIYAFGCILAEMLTGQPPVPKMELAEMARAHCRGPRPHVTMTSRGESVPVALTNFIKRCTATDPARRYAVAQEALEVLEGIDRERDAAPVPQLTPSPGWPADPSGSDIGPMMGAEPVGTPPPASMASSDSLDIMSPRPLPGMEAPSATPIPTTSLGNMEEPGLGSSSDQPRTDSVSISRSRELSWESVEVPKQPQPSRRVLLFGAVLAVAAAAIILVVALRSPDDERFTSTRRPQPTRPALPAHDADPPSSAEALAAAGATEPDVDGPPAEPTRVGETVELAEVVPDPVPTVAGGAGLMPTSPEPLKATPDAEPPKADPVVAVRPPDAGVAEEPERPSPSVAKARRRRKAAQARRARRRAEAAAASKLGKEKAEQATAVASVKAQPEPDPSPKTQEVPAEAKKLYAQARDAEKRGAPRSAQRFYVRALGKGLVGPEAREAHKRIKVLQARMDMEQREF